MTTERTLRELPLAIAFVVIAFVAMKLAGCE